MQEYVCADADTNIIMNENVPKYESAGFLLKATTIQWTHDIDGDVGKGSVHNWALYY